MTGGETSPPLRPTQQTPLCGRINVHACAMLPATQYRLTFTLHGRSRRGLHAAAPCLPDGRPQQQQPRRRNRSQQACHALTPDSQPDPNAAPGPAAATPTQQPAVAPPHPMSEAVHGAQACAAEAAPTTATTSSNNGGAPIPGAKHAARGGVAQQPDESLPPGYDPAAARPWLAPRGEPQLWWVKKFEARRKEEAAAKASDPAFTTTEERMKERGQGVAARVGAAVLQLLQLTLVVALLVLWPASLHDGGLEFARVWGLYGAYWLFFAAGSVYRILAHGRLARRSSDKQVSSGWAARLAFVVFVAVVPLLHWAAMYRFVGVGLYHRAVGAAPAGTTLYDILGGGAIAAAIGLNVWASRELGPAYNRVVAPERLVTSGPYRWVQHPIYTSYVMLFVGYCLCLHSAAFAIMLLGVCGLYYSLRTRLEAAVLLGAFGDQYDQYRQRTKMFLPAIV